MGRSLQAGLPPGNNDLGICDPSFAYHCPFLPRVGHIPGKHYANRIWREETVVLSRFGNFHKANKSDTLRLPRFFADF